MIFRKQGKIIEIQRSQFKTDKSYYNEIYMLQKENREMDNSHVIAPDPSPIDTQSNSTTTTTTCQFVTNLLLKHNRV